MFKMGLEKAEESETKLPTSAGSENKQENSRKASTPVSFTILKPLTEWITKPLWKILRVGNTKSPYLPPEKSVHRSRSNS